MKTRINIATCNGYILSNGKLTAYEYKSAKVDFATGEVEYDCILGGVPTTFKTTDIIKVYKDEDAYKRDQVFNDYTYSWGEFVRSTIGYTPYELDDDEDCAKAYCVKNGEVVETAFPTIFIMEKGKQSRYVGDRVYTSRDEAMLYCDIIKVEADGTETRCSSPASLVMLNEEQMVAFKAVEEALKKARELGIKFACDTEHESLYAYSDKHIKGYNYEYDENDFITEFGYRIDGLMTEMSLSPMCVNLSDTCVYAKFKEE